MKKRAIFYDTETTGLDARTERIVEIAAYDPLYDKTFVQLINPGICIPKAATQIHGISDEMVAHAKSFTQVGQEFIDFCGPDAILVAHNNDEFDRHFLFAEAKRAHLTLPNWPMIDTLKWARKYRPDLPRHSLQFLRQVYAIAERRAHRALDDVQVLFELFQEMTDDLTLDEILELMAEPRATESRARALI